MYQRGTPQTYETMDLLVAHEASSVHKPHNTKVLDKRTYIL